MLENLQVINMAIRESKFLKHIVIISFLIFLSFNLFAENIGAGLSFSGSWINTQAEGYSDANKNVVSGTATMIFGVSDDIEIDPFLGYGMTSYSDPDSIQSYQDGSVYSVYQFGVCVNKSVFISGPFVLLLGGEISGDIYTRNNEINHWTYSAYAIGLALPLTLEYKITPNLAARISDNLISFRSFNETDEYSYQGVSSTDSYHETYFNCLTNGLKLGIFYYF